MLVSDSRKFIFIHIPRTAGMSLRSALEPFADAATRDYIGPACAADIETWDYKF